MAAFVLPSIQPAPISIPLGAILLALGGVLLLAMVLGGLLALRFRPSPSFRPSRLLDEVLDALPFPAAIVEPNGRALTINGEAASWLETSAPQRLVSPLRTLVRRVADNRRVETSRVTPVEGQPGFRVVATPLFEGERTLSGVLLLAPPASGEASLNLTRLVAHELRTPLTAIVGHSEILGSCEPGEEALWRRSRDFIAAETQRLARLVDDLLALSRLEASSPLIQAVNLRAVVERALSRLFDRAEAEGLTLTLDSPSSLPRVRADADRLEQALINLLDNAIKYTPSGGTVTVCLTPEGGYVCVDVCDTGPGILPEDLPHLFDPLYRAESVRDLPGTGLGLTIVQTILNQHGAPISVRSRQGEGATFTFRLPIAR